MDSIVNKLSQLGKSFLNYWTNQTKSKRIQIIVLAFLIVSISIFTAVMLNKKSYDVLYTNLSASDAGEILQTLEEMGIDAKSSGVDTILVESGVVDLTRMELAANGLPKSSANLDILQMATGFGVTEEDKAIYRRYQLQDDLQNAIKTFDSVEDVRVSLHIPKESVFVIENQTSKATAAILINLRPGRTLSSANVKAIAELVEKSVPNLKSDNISIIDGNMNLLSFDEDSGEFAVHDQLQMQEQVSDRLRKQITDLLQPVFGIGNVMAQVNAVLNFDENIIDSISFEPVEGTNEGIIASIDSIREISRNVLGQDGGEPGTGNNAGGAPVYPVLDTSDEIYEKNSEHIIYEINTLKEHIVKAKGTIKNLSVSVVLDQNITSGQDYTESVSNIVSNAIGVSADYITVETLPFNGNDQMNEVWDEYNQVLLRAQRIDQIKFAVVVVIGVVFAIILMILIFKKSKSVSKNDNVDHMFPSLKRSSNTQTEASMKTQEEIQDKVGAGEIFLEELKNEDRVTVQKNIDKNPELAATIIRSWMAEEEN